MQQRASYKYEYIPRIQNYAVFFENGFKEKMGGLSFPKFWSPIGRRISFRQMFLGLEIRYFL